MVMLSPSFCTDVPCLVFLMSSNSSNHNCGWDLVLSCPTVGAKMFLSIDLVVG